VLKAGGNGKLSAQAGKGEMEWGGGSSFMPHKRLRERERGGVLMARGDRWGSVLA
jgi:hypothetical protein